MLLLLHLQNLRFQATGTMRENWLSECPSKESKLLRKEKMGTFDYRFDYDEETPILK